MDHLISITFNWPRVPQCHRWVEIVLNGFSFGLCCAPEPGYAYLRSNVPCIADDGTMAKYKYWSTPLILGV